MAALEVSVTLRTSSVSMTIRTLVCTWTAWDSMGGLVSLPSATTGTNALNVH